MNYGTIIDNQLYPAPRAVRVGGCVVCNPSAEDFARLNAERAAQGLPPYLPVVDTPPSESPTQGWHYEARGWVESGGAWRRQYVIAQDPPPPPRTFDKYRLVDALMRRNVWEQVKAWLQSTPNAYDRAVMAPDISEDEPLLADGIAAVKELLGWTDEQVEAVLAASAI
jgi:hypothetical protein